MLLFMSKDVLAADLDALLDSPKGHHAEIIAEVDKAEASYKQRLIVEPKLIKVLNASGYSAESKTFIAEQLYRICDEDTVEDFVKLLYRSGTGTLAAKGLGIIKHRDAQRALLEHLPKVGITTRNAIIEALGNRQDDTAITPISKYVRSSNSATSKATLIALGKIGGPQSAQILGISRLSVSKSLQGVATEAYLQCGWNALERGDLLTALDVFDLLFIGIEPLEVQTEALRGLIRTEKDDAMPYIVEALKSEEVALQTVAVEEASRIPGTNATKSLVKIYSDMQGTRQALIVKILGLRADEEGLFTVIQASWSRDPQVRLSALEALSHFRQTQVLQPLLKASAEGTVEEQAVARASLSSLQGDDINRGLAKLLLDPNNAIRFEAVRLMPIRGASEGLPGLVRIVERGDLPIIQFEALQAICIMGTVVELPVLVKAWTESKWSIEQRAIIGEGIVAVAQRSPAGRERVAALHDALKGSVTPEAQIAVIEALSRIQEDESVDALDSLFRKADPSVQTVILNVWSDWPTIEALPELEKQARTQDNVELRDIAFKGLARILNEVADPEHPDTARYCQKAAKVANTTDERRSLFPVISSLSPEASEKIWHQLLKADASLSDEIAELRN